MKTTIKKKVQPKNITAWVVNHFPENIAELTYFEPYADGGNVILNKPPSLFEILNFVEPESALLFRAIRNSIDELISEAQKIPQNRKHFKFLQGEANSAVKELMLKKMSKNSTKQTFFNNKAKKPKYGSVWQTSFSDLQELSHRFKEIIILQQDQLKPLIKSFNDPNSMIFLDPTGILPKREKELSIEKQKELFNLIADFSCKVLIILPYCSELAKPPAPWMAEKRKIGSSVKEIILKNY